MNARGVWRSFLYTVRKPTVHVRVEVAASHRVPRRLRPLPALSCTAQPRLAPANEEAPPADDPMEFSHHSGYHLGSMRAHLLARPDLFASGPDKDPTWLVPFSKPRVCSGFCDQCGESI